MRLSATRSNYALAIIFVLLAGCSNGSPGSQTLPVGSLGAPQSMGVQPGVVQQIGQKRHGVRPTVTESVLHSFAGGSDGEVPWAPLTKVNGAFYGTAYVGGGSGCGGSGCGLVYRITRSGKETVLYTFTGDSDGANPQAGLTNVNGTLYGATLYGGAGCGCGTVFSVTTSGAETVLYTVFALSL